MSGSKVAFIGAGNMAQALARGFISAGMCKPNNIIASSPVHDQHLLEAMSKLGCNTTHCNAEAASTSDVVIVSVKPNVVPPVLADISRVGPRVPLVASVAIGVTTSDMESRLPSDTRVVRILPNTPVMVHLGSSVFAKGKCATKDDGSLVERLMRSVGECDEVPEVFLNAVSGLSGAGPAYMYLVIEALADGGVKMGLPRPLALKLASQTMLGAAKMVIDTGKLPGMLKDEVCSPGGCTIQGVSALENGGLRAALINAVTDATDRSSSLSLLKPN